MSFREPWEGYCKPFRMFGNLFFVGTEPASTHIVDTGDGYLLFDSGFQHSLYLVLHNMHLLGLNPKISDISFTRTDISTTWARPKRL